MFGRNPCLWCGLHPGYQSHIIHGGFINHHYLGRRIPDRRCKAPNQKTSDKSDNQARLRCWFRVLCALYFVVLLQCPLHSAAQSADCTIIRLETQTRLPKTKDFLAIPLLLQQFHRRPLHILSQEVPKAYAFHQLFR